MKYKNKATGTVYNVTNESLIPQYEKDERFEKVAETVAKAEPKAKEKATKK